LNQLIKLTDIVKTYRSGDKIIHALNHINLTIKEGEFVAITGKSGSGKSTLMNLLGCLDFATSGTYQLDGVDVTTLNDRRISKIRNQKIGFIFQGFNLIPCLNAIENVELPLTYRKIPAKRRRALAVFALEQVGLAERMHHKPSQMSGGQQQRVAIARAIAAKPPVILADEPTGNLDSESGAEILSILSALHQSGKTVILITHDRDIASVTQRQIEITNGIVNKDIYQ
jgi:putative ABC transport system ATP-binding protein